MCQPNTLEPVKRGFDVDVWLDGENGFLCAQTKDKPPMVLWTSIHVVAGTKDEAEKEAAAQFYRGLIMKVRAEVRG